MDSFKPLGNQLKSIISNPDYSDPEKAFRDTMDKLLDNVLVGEIANQPN